MDLPALLPKQLHYVSVAKDDRNLFNMLVKLPADFIVFFEYATDDETWSEKHQEFMQSALNYFQEAFFQDKILQDTALRVVKKVQEHHQILLLKLQKNVEFVFDKIEKKQSSLLWQASSEYLRNLIRQECRDKDKKTLNLGFVDQSIFYQMEEFVTTGRVKELWAKELSEVLDLLKQASQWGMLDLMHLSQDQLKKFITKTNVISLLIDAHEAGWNRLKNHCIDFFNAFDFGVKFKKDEGEIALEFFNFKRAAMEVFDALHSAVTRLICRNALTEEEGFRAVVSRCPKLRSLDIGQSFAFSDHLFAIPEKLKALDLSDCEWLTHENFKKMLEICPHLHKICLAGNQQLRFSSWGLLKNLENLRNLDISRCHQVTDEDFMLVLQACRHIEFLSLSECKSLSDLSFFEIGKHIPGLTFLDLSRTEVTDSGLVDISTRCQGLFALKAMRCPHITARGILEVVENLPDLKRLGVSKGVLTSDTVKKLKAHLTHF